MTGDQPDRIAAVAKVLFQSGAQTGQFQSPKVAQVGLQRVYRPAQGTAFRTRIGDHRHMPRGFATEIGDQLHQIIAVAAHDLVQRVQRLLIQHGTNHLQGKPGRQVATPAKRRSSHRARQSCRNFPLIAWRGAFTFWVIIDLCHRLCLRAEWSRFLFSVCKSFDVPLLSARPAFSDGPPRPSPPLPTGMLPARSESRKAIRLATLSEVKGRPEGMPRCDSKMIFLPPSRCVPASSASRAGGTN